MEFYVVVLQWRQKSVLKSEVRAELLFVLLKIPFFLISRVPVAVVVAAYLLPRRKTKSKKGIKMSNVPYSLAATRLSPNWLVTEVFRAEATISRACRSAPINPYLCKLLYVHSLFSEPVKKSSSPVHDPKLEVKPFKQFLYGCVVGNECSRHFHSMRWNITNCNFGIVRDPFNEMSGVFVLDSRHLIFDFLHW